MAINNANNVGPLFQQNAQNALNVNDVAANKKTPATTVTVNQGNAIADRVEISTQAKTINAAVQNINNLPEIRTQDVEKAVQNRVVENNRVPAGQLAAKLLFKE